MVDTPVIEEIKDIPEERNVLQLLNSSIKDWISQDLGSINELQRVTIPRIMGMKHTLVMAPTGAGKTLAAFLGIISTLCSMEEEGILEEKIYTIYISPLKALNNDIHKNLEIPLSKIRELHDNNISIAKRTGDTTSKERTRMVRKPPHILITTPESLALMLTAPKFKENLRSIRWVIVDEIHALADNKRGSLLSICLERLEYYLEKPPTRIGLSATVEPPSIVANYLVGARDVKIGLVNMGRLRKLDIQVITPTKNLVHAPYNEVRKRHVEIIENVIRNNRTSLIFTNTRHMAEKLLLDMQKTHPDLTEKIAVHHGSLSKQVRLEVEERLKTGKMKAVFTSTSLEMGIDIGTIDKTVQLSSPKTVRSFTQRIGRSGHSQNLQSKGDLLAFDRDDLVECMAIARLSTQGLVDRIRIPDRPADVLFQMLVGMAVERRWSIQDAFEVIKRSYPYRNYVYEDFYQLLRSAANTTNDDNSWKYSMIWLDEEIAEFGKRKRSRQSYMQNIGTIPDTAMVDVILETFRTRIGKIADRFAENLTEEDVFILGGKTYQYVRTVGNKIIVRESFGKIPNIPSWVGEAQTRTLEVSQEISNMYKTVDNMLDDEKDVINWLKKRYYVSDMGATSVITYIKEQRAVSELPNLKKLVIEEYIEPSGAKSIIVLSIFGRETNLVLAQLLATKLSINVGISVSTITTDNGILLRLPMGYDYNYKMLFENLDTDSLLQSLDKKVRQSELFKNRFRQVAGRALMVLKRSGSRKNSLEMQTKQARWLLKMLDDEYPIIMETVREIMHDTYNLGNAISILKGIEEKSIHTVFIPSENIPSPMTHSILLNDNSDIVLMDDRKSLLLNLHQQVLSRMLPDRAISKPIFEEDEIVNSFQKKLNADEHGEGEVVHRFAEYTRLKTDFIAECREATGVPENRIREIISNSDEIVKWQGYYTTRRILPYHAACHAVDIWDEYDSSFEELKIRSREMSPSSGIEYLIFYLLKYSGPIDFEEIKLLLNKRETQLRPVLQSMVRKHQVLKGAFTKSSQQYMLYEDRKLLLRSTSAKINLDTLTAYRLQKLRLSQKYQSISMGIKDYLEQNGPARDTIELVSRLPSFDWLVLRDLLAGKEIYFGRFLGRRLVFISAVQVKHFITITRERDVYMNELEREVYLLIQEMHGLTTQEIMKFTKQTKNAVQNAINALEYNLYISRVGWELSLTQGGFPNPQYIPLPPVEITDLNYSESARWLLQQCLHWYGPLTLQDLLRITRLSFNTIETMIKQLQVTVKEILSFSYYGYDEQFALLEKSIGFTDEVFLLSPLDPYFYMITGSFRQDQLPRQTRLMVVRNGKTLARIEMMLPDKDILQVLNLQISKKNAEDFDLLESIGKQLLRIAKRAFSTQVVIIEEINFKAANHRENSNIILALKRADFSLNRDFLICGTHSTNEFQYRDIIESRLVHMERVESKNYKSVSEIFDHHDILRADIALSMLNITEKNAKLLLSRAIREGKIHHKSGFLYHPLYWKTSTPIPKQLSNIFEEQQILTTNEIMQRGKLTKKETNDLLIKYMHTTNLENISPFSRTTEYRLNHSPSIPRSQLLLDIMIRIVRRYGPITFGGIRKRFKEIMHVSRIEILLKLAIAVEKSKILTYSAHLDGKATLVYLLPEQQSILLDKKRTHGLEQFKVYQVNNAIFEQLGSRTTHVLTKQGYPIVELVVKIDTDTAVIEELNFLEEVEMENQLAEQLLCMEKYFLDKGYQRIQINKIQNSYPSFWIS